MRLVDANEKQIIIQDLEMHHDSQFTPGVYEHSVFGKAALLLESTVDVVEVVRCKDCKWYKPGDLFTDIMFCHRLKKDNGKPAKYNFCEDDFCSYGERRTDG